MNVWLLGVSLAICPHWNQIGVRAYLGHDDVRAESAYAHALRCPQLDDPARARVSSNQAALLRRQRRYREAAAALRETIRLRTQSLGPHHPDTLIAWNNLGELHFTLREFSAAQQELEFALRHAATADRPAILHNLAALALARGRIPAAEQLARQALQEKFDRHSPSRDLLTTSNLLQSIQAMTLR